jgi:hypothetical protein
MSCLGFPNMTHQTKTIQDLEYRSSHALEILSEIFLDILSIKGKLTRIFGCVVWCRVYIVTLRVSVDFNYIKCIQR